MVLHPPPNLSSLYNHFNNISNDTNKDPENVANCKYYEIEELSRLFSETPNDNSLKLFHLNISSLPKHIDSLENLLSSSKINFDVIAISETRISSNNMCAHNLALDNYSFEYCPTESSAGGSGIYIRNDHSYISRPDLNINKSCQVESTFIEVSLPKKSNIIVGCIYRHHNMKLNEFNEYFLNPLLEKLSKENKSTFLLGDFNVDLLKYDHHASTNEFLDSFSSHFFLPHILVPTRISGSSKSLIDNIFSNEISNNIISGNITASLSDHLPQFSIIPDILGNPSSPKTNMFERNWSGFNQQSFVLDFFEIDWPNTLNVDGLNVNNSFETFIKSMNYLLGKLPLKKLVRIDLNLN